VSDALTSRGYLLVSHFRDVWVNPALERSRKRQRSRQQAVQTTGGEPPSGLQEHDIQSEPNNDSAASPQIVSEDNASVRYEESSQTHSLDRLLETSIDLDEAAKRDVQKILAIGPKRFAREIAVLLDSVYNAVEQNSNLLRILRSKMRTSEK
jgi:hypothetical protein